MGFVLFDPGGRATDTLNPMAGRQCPGEIGDAAPSTPPPGPAENLFRVYRSPTTTFLLCDKQQHSLGSVYQLAFLGFVYFCFLTGYPDGSVDWGQAGPITAGFACAGG